MAMLADGKQQQAAASAFCAEVARTALCTMMTGGFCQSSPWPLHAIASNSNTCRKPALRQCLHSLFW